MERWPKMNPTDLPVQYQGGYSPPGNPETDVYLVPVSGGADSSWLAILLRQMWPDLPVRYVFTDTGAEEQETLDYLDRLQDYLGQPIERLMGEAGLFDLVAQYGGFLPSPRDRYCTRVLKLEPFRDWISQFSGIQKWMFVGIRQDEDRLAFTLDEVGTVMPFVDLGVTREQVYRGLAGTIGIPRTYKTRSRSGCTTCPYQRTNELVGLLQRNPAAFRQGAALEKLDAVDLARHAEGVPLWRDTRTSANWLSLPMPDSSEDLQGRGKKAKAPDLFGARVFVGGEFFLAGFPGLEEFCWHQRVACFSTTLAGVKQQLDGRYQHLLGTSEVYEMDPDTLRQSARFAIWMVELPSDVFDPEGPKGHGYTWHQGKSYRQIQHIVDWATRALHAEHMRQEAAKSPHPLTVQHEWSEASRESLAMAQAPLGSVLLSQWYQPSEKVHEPETEDEALRRIPCPMCQI